MITPVVSRVVSPVVSRVARQFSPLAYDYFARLDDAGDTDYLAYRTQIARYIDRVEGDIGWDKIGASCLFAGVGFPGCFVPVRSDMPVPMNVNFTSDRHDPTTGLRGDGSTMRINTKIKGSDLGLTDASAGVYLTESDTQTDETAGLLGDSSTNTDSLQILFSSGNSTLARLHNNTLYVHSTGGRGETGLIGKTRGNASTAHLRATGVTDDAPRDADGQTGDEINIFARLASDYTDARLATYWLGADLTKDGLAEMDAIQTEFVLAITPTIFD